MPNKHPNADRWGGPGSSHENRAKPRPPKWQPTDGEPTNPRTSLVSGGGGERDLRHSHDNRYRSSKASKDKLKGENASGVTHREHPHRQYPHVDLSGRR